MKTEKAGRTYFVVSLAGIRTEGQSWSLKEGTKPNYVFIVQLCVFRIYLISLNPSCVNQQECTNPFREEIKKSPVNPLRV